MQQTKLLIELQTCCIGQHYLSFVTYVLCLIIRDKFEKVFKAQLSGWTLDLGIVYNLHASIF